MAAELGLHPALGAPAARARATGRPWRLDQNYLVDRRIIQRAKIDDGVMRFT